MAGNIKGITIEFRGDDSNLKSAINRIRNEAKTLDKELQYVNKSLKFDPTNVALWEQKQKILTQEVKNTSDRLDELKNIKAQLEKQGLDNNTAEFREVEREIAKAESQLKQFNKELKQIPDAKAKALEASFAQVGNKLVSAGQALRGLSTAAAGFDVALGALAYKSGDAADELNTLAQVTGISTQELQKYKATADLVDVSVETIAKSQTKMKKSMLSAAQGTKSTAQAFETLGVSITDTNGELRSQDEVFAETIAALGQMSNETERDALSMQIFGRSATELNPLIEDNGETYLRVAQIFRDNDLELVDQETIDKANQFNDAIDEIKMTGAAALNSLGMQLAGYLAPAIEKVADWVEKLFSWLSKLDPEILTIIGIIAGVVAGIGPLLIIIGKLSLAISSIMGLMSTLGISMTALAGPIGIAIAAIAALIAAGVFLYNHWEDVKKYAAQLRDWIVDKWNSLKEGVVNAITTVKEKVLYYWEALKLGMSIIFNTIKSVVSNTWENIKTAIVTPIAKAVDFVKTAIDKIKGFFSGLKIELPHIKLPHFKLTGSFSLAPPSVPKLSVDWYKTGGIFTSPQIIGVGEAGAEAVLPIEKLKGLLGDMGGVTVNVYGSNNMNVDELALKVQQRIIALQNSRRQVWE